MGKKDDCRLQLNQLAELDETYSVLEEENPDKVIVFGGDCSISQAPFDYLNEKYDNEVGLIWLDAHPDISTKEISNHNHEFILANLLGLGDTSFSRKVSAPIKSENVIYAGLVEDARGKLDRLNLNIPIITPKEIIENPEIIERWISTHNIKNICVHFDLDVLSPEYFRSLTSSKPGQTEEEYGAAIGKLKLAEVVRFLNITNSIAPIVGLAIAEYMPWDAIYLREALSQLEIFHA